MYYTPTVTHRYDDIISLPHHVSQRRPRLTMRQRAAQFAPFAALQGYEEEVAEAARETSPRIYLDEAEKYALSDRLRLLSERLSGHPAFTAVFFRPDERKAGGAYLKVTGFAVKVDTLGQRLLMSDGTVIPFDDLVSLSGDIFSELDK